MSEFDNSFESSLLQMASPSHSRLTRLQLALADLAIISDSEQLVSFTEIAPWHRSGAESYMAVAEAHLEDVSNRYCVRSFVGKAIVTWSPSIEQRIAELVARYAILKRFGVRIPELYSAKAGVIYQEYIPDQLTPQLITERHGLLDDFCGVAATLDYLGARPLDFPRDLMVKSEHIYFVDVGEDLGGFRQSQTESAKRQMIAYLPDSMRAAAEQIYESRTKELNLIGDFFDRTDIGCVET